MNDQSRESKNILTKNSNYVLLTLLIFIVIGLLAVNFFMIVDNNPNASPAVLSPEISPEKKITGKIDIFGNMMAFSRNQDEHNYMIFAEGKKETIIDQGDDKFNDSYSNIAELKFFSSPKFSPDGNYLSYLVSAYEWTYTKIYDVKDKIVLSKKFSLFDFGFAEDKKYFYECEANDFSGDFYGRVLGLPDFEVKYELSLYELSLEKIRGEKILTNIRCEYDKDKKIIRFIISSLETNKDRIVEYSLVDNKVRE